MALPNLFVFPCRLIMMASSLPSAEESVQPSTVLMNELHRRLLNPGVVSAFEQEHRHTTNHHHYLIDRVVRPRWVLLPTATADGGSDGSIADDAANIHDNVKQNHVEDTRTTSLKRKYQSNNSNDNELYELEINSCYSTNDKKKLGNNERYIVNGIPTRNYIDLRMEQNRIFADDQSSKCRDILSTIKLLSDQSSDKERSSSYSISNNKNDDDNELEKHTKLLHSLLHEGLSACPNHVSLLEVQSNYAEWLQGNVKMLILDETIIDDTSTKSTLISNKDTQHDSTIHVTRCEGRAHAAMRDVLTERSMHGGGDNNGDATTMVRGYSLLPTTDADDTIVMYGAAALGGGGGRKNTSQHHDELNRNESPPCNDHRQRRREHDRKRRRSKDDRKRKRRRRKEHDQSSSSLVHDRHRHRRRSQSCESSDSNRSEVSTSSSCTHSSSSSSSYSRRRKRQHRKEKKSRRSSKSKAKKKSKKSKHHYRRKSQSCNTTGEEEGNNDGSVVETLEERSI